MTKTKILIVDDNERACDNLKDILELKNYQTYGVYDGYQAIQAVQQKTFDIVLVDVKMPGISGIEVVNILKNIAPKLTFIIITAFADDTVYKETIQNANLKIIQKPIDIDKLYSILENIRSLSASDNDKEPT